MFEKGKIILVPFPFTDLSSEKMRPAVIISDLKHMKKDIVVAFITSNLREKGEFNVLVDEKHRGFNKTGLKKSSLIRPNKLTTLDKKVVLGELGDLPKELEQKLNIALKRVF